MFENFRNNDRQTLSAKLKSGKTDFGTNPFKPSRFPDTGSLFGRL